MVESVADARPLPLIRWSAWMIGVGVLSGLAIVAIAPLWAKDSASLAIARKAVVAATVVTMVASIFGLVPVSMLRRLGESWSAFAWSAAMPFRFGLSIAGASALVVIGKQPTATTVLTMVVVYLALLATETTLMFRFTQAGLTDNVGSAGNDE